MAFNFDGDKYEQASKHQKEWGGQMIAGLPLNGNECILDLGCGDGVLTRQLALRVPNGQVLGIDTSAGMIETAKQKTDGNLSFALKNIMDIDFADEFDIIFSNAALHWVKNHEKLLAACKKALKTNGTLRWSFGGFGNSAALNETLMNAMEMPAYESLFKGFEWPWYMPKKEEYEALVKTAGYQSYTVTIENNDRYFTREALVKWIDQPCIVPFLAYIKDEQAKDAFRDTVVTHMLAKTFRGDEAYFEMFRRIHVAADK